MASPFILVVLYSLALVTTSQFQTYYVGRSGIDNITCGATVSNQCGTLYKASRLIQQAFMDSDDTSFVIHVLNGQNEEEIAKYHIDDSVVYDPCLPIPFNSNLHITVTFDPSNIHDLNDWYPRNICEYDIDKKYLNEYMFDGGRSLKINNLIINNYGEKHFYPFIRSTDHYNASITCIQCRFASIIYNTSRANHSKPLFHTKSSIYMIQSSFLNMDTSVASHFDHGPLIYCDHERLTRDSTRYFVFMESTFINIAHIESIVELKVSSVRDADRPPTVTIKKSVFKNVSTKKSIIYDDTSFIAVIINDTVFDNIISRYIYYGTDAGASRDVRIDNVSVTSIAQLFKYNKYALFYFTGTDVTVAINDMYIHYIYDTDKSCTVSNNSPVVNTQMNMTCEVKGCSNPVRAIYAVGTVQMANIKINMDVVPAYNEQGKCRQLSFYSGKDSNAMALITNTGHMIMRNVSIGRPVCHELIYNSNILSVDNLSVNRDKYDPNELQSSDIIKSQGEFSMLYVSNSHFFGSGKQIHAKGGVGTVSDSVFEQSGLPMYIDTCDKFTVIRSEIKHVGKFNGIVQKDSYFNDYVTQPFRIWKSKDILLINNSITGFDPKGILFIGYTENVTIIGNTFNIDTTELFYKVQPKYITFSTSSHAPFYAKYSSNIRFLHNIFDKNPVDSDQYWLSYYKNEGVNCFSSNTFTNVAMYIKATNITSCFRPGLIDGVYNGSIDASLLGKMNHFLLDIQQNIPFVMKLSEVVMALDQLNISWITSDRTRKTNDTLSTAILMRDSDLLIVDSFVSGDISYKNTLCNVLQNDRLTDNIEGVARLQITCAYDTSYGAQYAWNETLDSNRTRLVDHFSATKLNFSTESWSYYPGELLHFEYSITDILGNVIDYPLSEDGLVVQLQSNRFSTEFNIIHISTNAILLTDVSINDNAGDEYDIYVNLEKDLFVAEYPMIALNITGCPMGYGPDRNNISCSVCDTDSYNLIQNNVNRCSSCNPDLNSGIKCMDGTILVAEGYWIGFDDDHNIMSSMCLPSYCCSKKNKCNYQNKEELCALHRDPDSPLCSKCMEGYSESMNSINCVQCDKASELQYLLTPLLLAFAFSVIVIRTDNVRKDEKEDAYLNPSLSRWRYMQIMIRIMITKCVLYYEQAISEIVFKLTPLSHFASVFNLSVIANSFTSTDMCFVDGLSAKQKILLDLLIPMVMVVICGSFYCFFLLITKGTLLLCCGKRKFNFGKMFLSLLTLAVGKILDVLFQLLSCKTIGNRIQHFYFADEECFGATWITAFISLIVIILSFSALFIKVKRMSLNERQNPTNAMFVVTSRYKPQFYFWEFVIFIRRILIALFAAFAHQMIMKLGFIIVITCFAVLQHSYAPFIIHEANNMEAVLLHCLMFVIVIQFPYTFHLDPMLISVVLSILIIFPVPLMLYYILRVMLLRNPSWKKVIGARKKKKQQISEDSYDHSDEDIIQVVNGVYHRKTVANPPRKQSVEMYEQKVLVHAMCAACQKTKQCQQYEHGSFFCGECLQQYDDLYEEEFGRRVTE